MQYGRKFASNQGWSVYENDSFAWWILNFYPMRWICQFFLLPEAFCLGTSDQDSEDTWVWSSTGQTVLFTDWCIPEEQPNNYNGDQDCLVIRDCPEGGTEFGWYDDRCDELRYYIWCVSYDLFVSIKWLLLLLLLLLLLHQRAHLD